MFVIAMDSYCKVLHFIFVWSMAILRTADGGSITWFEPPPAETTSNDLKQLIADSQSIREGSTNVPLRWNFTLTVDTNPIILLVIALNLNGVPVANIAPSGQVGIQTNFQGRYNISWIPQQITMIIFNVTSEDNGEFGCEVSTLEGGSSKVWRRKMTVEVVAETSFNGTLSGDQTITEGSNLTLDCPATGTPTPNVTWTRVLKNGTDGEQVFSGNPWVIVNINRTFTGTYRCTAYNGIGNPVNHSLHINVTYPADITHISGKKTVNENEEVTLNCSAKGNPTPNITWRRVSDNSPLSFPLTITGKQDEGGYSCTAYNGIGNPANQVVYIIVERYHPIDTNLMTSFVGNSVVVNTYFNITCSAQANPPAKYRFYKNQDNFANDTTGSNVSVVTTSVSERRKQETYSCTPFNDFGDGLTDGLTLTVLYAPDTTTLTTVPSNRTVLRGSNMTLKCTTNANPDAHIYHFYLNDKLIGNSSSGVFNTTVMVDGVYTCVPINTVGTRDNATIDVTAVVPESNSILVRLNVTNKDCDDTPSDICEQMRKEVEEEIKKDDVLGERLTNVTEENCECGSVIAYLSLDFTENVKIPDVISVLKKAAENGSFGELQVNPGSIQAISREQLPTDPPSSTVGTTTSETEKEKDMLWIIIGASVGGAIVLIIVVAVVAWCVHHKRKCRRKGSKVRCSESDAFAPEEGNDYGYANNGYADAGPRPSEVKDVSQHQGASGSAAVPTYAVVDKSAKKESKKDKKVEEEKPQAAPPQYAAVDKSKKKKKEEPEATYAQVDKSKKSKKQKPKPDEVVYADLGDYHQMKELPAVSTSPQALPPIKKPTPYGETQYADITQFLKGDATLPESNNSQGPGTGTQAPSAPENSNSQEPAGTSTKETSQASNPGGDGGPGHETNF